MKTVLIYVLSAHTHPYGEMIKTAMDTWDTEPLEGTRTVYYCGEPTGGDTERVISFNVSHGLETIGQKTLLAFKKALDWEWDYMARPNSSCYVHKRRVLEHVQTLSEKGVMQGITLGPTWHCRVDHDWMWGGGQFIFSRDVIQAFVDNGSQWRHDLMEDVAMSALAHHLDIALDGTGKVCSIEKTENGWMVITYHGSPSFEFAEFSELARLNDQYFVRCKQDLRRHADADVMRLLKQHLLP